MRPKWLEINGFKYFRFKTRYGGRSLIIMQSLKLDLNPNVINFESEYQETITTAKCRGLGNTAKNRIFYLITLATNMAKTKLKIKQEEF